MFRAMALTPEQLFQALSDPTRLRIAALLWKEGELCVCELTQALGLSQPMISRHLAALRAAGVVSDRRAGIWVHYQVHADLPAWARSVIDATMAGLARSHPYQADRRALKSLAPRPRTDRCG